MKTDADRGYIGAWMRRERLRRDLSDVAVVGLLAEQGHAIRVDYYRQLEAGTGGKRPGPELLEAMERVFESAPIQPPEPLPEASADEAVLVELRHMRQAQEAIAETLQLVAAYLAQLTTPAPQPVEGVDPASGDNRRHRPE